MRRHAFEPARLLLGLALLGLAPAYVMTATGQWDIPLPVLLPLLPAALLLAGATAAVTYFVRRGGHDRHGGHRGKAVPPPDGTASNGLPPDGLPVEELRRGYDGTRPSP